MIDALARERLTMGLVTLPLLGRGSRPSSLRYQSIKDGVGFGHIDGNCRIDQFDFQRTARRNLQVRHVVGMIGTRHDAVMRVARIEVRPRRVERGLLALGHGMNVDGMLARRHSLERELEQAPGRGLQ